MQSGQRRLFLQIRKADRELTANAPAQQSPQMGNTSITFKIEARKVSVYTGEEDVVVTTNITFVRIDEEGKPTPIPTIVKDRFKDKHI